MIIIHEQEKFTQSNAFSSSGSNRLRIVKFKLSLGYVDNLFIFLDYIYLSFLTCMVRRERVISICTEYKKKKKSLATVFLFLHLFYYGVIAV